MLTINDDNNIELSIIHVNWTYCLLLVNAIKLKYYINHSCKLILLFIILVNEIIPKCSINHSCKLILLFIVLVNAIILKY